MPVLYQLIKQLQASTVISPHDGMYDADFEGHYYYVGRSNLLAIMNVINLRTGYPGGPAPLLNIYDFGCGHGRVCRWLRAAFSKARIYVTDYDKAGVEFCVEQFSCLDTGGEIPENSFDLIWLGSVFTHLPDYIVRPLLARLLAGLRPNGLLIFTTQGRYSVERMKAFDWENDKRAWMHYNLAKAEFDRLVQSYEQSGYGYVDYPDQKDYGVSIASQSWYLSQIKDNTNIVQLLFQEKGSDNHQDITAYMRAELTDDRKGPLW